MNDCLTKILANNSIPSPPSVAAEILKLAAQSDSTIEQVTKAISADPKLSCRLVAYCNSPIIGSRREISSLGQAVVTLGMRTVRLISLSFSLIETRDQGGFDYQSFWRRSLATAIASQLISKRASGNASESFLQGLVLNIGEIALANTFPDQYNAICDELGGYVDASTESDTFGVNRYQVGAKMLEKWNFPAAMVDKLEGHDPESLTHRSKPFHLAQMIARLLIDDQPRIQQIDEAKLHARAWFAIDEIQFAELFDEMLEHWYSYQSLFQFDAIPFDSFGFLEETAKQRLLEMALGMEREIASANAATRELKRTSLVDVLTKLKNRRAYETEVPGGLSQTPGQVFWHSGD
jgi:HD-like signal output (HDOD) protein